MNNEKKNSGDLDKIRQLISDAYQYMNSHPQKCIELSQSALEISRKINFPVGIGMAYMHIGLGFFHQSEYNLALKNYLLAEPLFKNEKYWYGLRSIYNNIGLIYDQWNYQEKALEYFQKNLELKDLYDDPKLSSTILNNISGIYLEQKNYEKALEYYQETMQLCLEKNLPYMLSVSYDNIARIYIHLKNSRLAEEYTQKAFDLKKQIKDFNGLSNVYQNLALLRNGEGKPAEALKLLNKAMYYSRKMKEWKNMAYIYQRVAQIYGEMGNQQQERANLKKCLNIAETRNYRSILLGVYSNLISIYISKSQYKKAFILQQKIQSVKDFLSDEKRMRSVEEIKTKMEVERTEREKAILQQKNTELIEKNLQIEEQKNQLQQTEKQLKELNQHLEERVQQETDKRRRQEQIIIQKSKLESLGQMAAGIAHEINQPVGLIKIAAQNLFHKFEQNKITPQYLQEKSAFIDENITRINKIIEHIRLFSRDQKESNQRFDVAQTVENALSLIQTQCRNHNIQICCEFQTGKYFTLGNKYRLEQVILNLLANARDALAEKFDEFDDAKKIIIRLFAESEKIIIEVEDNGCGIDEEFLPNVFDPFFTTKEESKGTGLGLSICYGIISEMNGSIILHSSKGEFTVTRIELVCCSGISEVRGER